jgi:hypothetical protein
LRERVVAAQEPRMKAEAVWAQAPGAALLRLPEQREQPEQVAAVEAGWQDWMP